MLAIKNAAPFGKLTGVQDLSGRVVPPSREEIPQHLPHIHLLMERGPTKPLILVGEDRNRIYGGKSFDYNSKFCTHGTLLANVVNSEANAVMYTRLEPEESRTAAIRLSLMVTPASIPEFDRKLDNTIIKGVDGAPVVKGTATFPGYILSWVTDTIDLDDGDVGDGEVINTLQAEYGPPSTGSTIYPIMDIPASSFGEFGNNVSVALSAATSKDTTPINVNFCKKEGTFEYNIAVFERLTKQGSPVNVKSLDGSSILRFALESGVIDSATNRMSSFDEVVAGAWTDKDSGSANTPTFGPVGDLHLYEENVDEVTKLLFAAEQAVPAVSSFGELTTAQQVNIVTAQNWDGVAYSAIRMATAAELAADAAVRAPTDTASLSRMTPTARHYLTGGDDGIRPRKLSKSDIAENDRRDQLYAADKTAYALAVDQWVAGDPVPTIPSHLGYIFDTNSQYNNAVRNAMLNWGNEEEYSLLDDAVFPMSCYYDSGFDIETKKTLNIPTGLRKDIYVIQSTQDVALPLNYPEQETSMALTIRGDMISRPESAHYGTGAIRGAIYQEAGTSLKGHAYRGLVPMTILIARSFARYQGASNGQWKAGKGYDLPGNNKVDDLVGINSYWKTGSQREDDWDLGINCSISYGRTSRVHLAHQTVYTDDTSILKSVMNMQCAVQLEKVHMSVWRDIAGDGSLTKEGRITKSNRLITERSDGTVFDNRLVCVADTYYTKQDDIRGYSWSSNIAMSGENMAGVGTLSITALRKGE